MPFQDRLGASSPTPEGSKVWLSGLEREMRTKKHLFLLCYTCSTQWRLYKLNVHLSLYLADTPDVPDLPYTWVSSNLTVLTVVVSCLLMKLIELLYFPARFALRLSKHREKPKGISNTVSCRGVWHLSIDFLFHHDWSLSHLAQIHYGFPQFFFFSTIVCHHQCVQLYA